MSVPTRNVILFGSTGSGKSSIINMLLGSDQAKTSSRATGCTFQNQPYDTDISGEQYRIFDTTGLDEGAEGTVISSDALGNLYNLLSGLTDGISLLAFVMRGPRITQQAQRNLSVFYDEKNVPVVIIVTGMEDEAPMDAWWTENEEYFQKRNMDFVGHACITATKGRKTPQGYRNQAEYDVSQDLVRDLIRRHCRPHGWKQASTVDLIFEVYIEN